jgi:hypothetical protein
MRQRPQIRLIRNDGRQGAHQGARARRHSRALGRPLESGSGRHSALRIK